jgi:hypothetical protein
MFVSEFQPYVSPATGKVITSRTERREDLKRSGCRPWESMEEEKKQAIKLKEEEDAKFEAGLEKCAHEVLNNMSSEAQAALTA